MENGAKHYFTGAACRRGHVSKRYVSTGQCATCQYENRIKWREENPEKDAESRLQSVRDWVARNPERKKELARKSNAKPEVSANNIARAAKWKLLNPDRATELNRTHDRNRRARKREAEGHHTADDIVRLLERQNFKCSECRASIREKTNRHVDHIIPLSRGGSNWPSNLQMLCAKCNLHKAARDPFEFANLKGRLL